MRNTNDKRYLKYIRYSLSGPFSLGTFRTIEWGKLDNVPYTFTFGVTFSKDSIIAETKNKRNSFIQKLNKVSYVKVYVGEKTKINYHVNVHIHTYMYLRMFVFRSN